MYVCIIKPVIKVNNYLSLFIKTFYYVLYAIDKCEIFCKKIYIFILFFHYVTVSFLNLPIFFILNLTLYTKTNVILILIYKVRYYINKPFNQLCQQQNILLIRFSFFLKPVVSNNGFIII